MNSMHLANLDLNLLRVFDVLLEERSVTRAGARLGLTPSAVSHALSRLRYHLGDELFQRDRAGHAADPPALEIGPSLHAALGQLQSALTPADFEPAISDRRFSVVAGAYACAVLMPAVVGASCRPRRPACCCRSPRTRRTWSSSSTAARSTSWSPASRSRPERFARERLMTEALAWVVRAGHPLCAAPATLEDLVSVPHVVVASPARGDGPARRSACAPAGRTSAPSRASSPSAACAARVGVVAPDTFSAMTIVARSEMAALIPRRLALLSVAERAPGADRAALRDARRWTSPCSTARTAWPSRRSPGCAT